jgi:hypothetical protein
LAGLAGFEPACVFVAFKHEKDALVALNNLPSKWSGFVALALNTSPNYFIMI